MFRFTAHEQIRRVAVTKQGSIETPLGRLQVRHARRIGRAIEEGIRGIIERLDQGTLNDALLTGDINAVLAELDLQALVGVIEEAQESVVDLVVAGVDVGRQELPSVARFALPQSLEIASPFIQPFIANRGAALVHLITDSQRRVVQDFIAEGFRTGRLLTETATEIMQTVGLLPRFAQAVQRLRAQLLDEGFSAVRANRTAQGYANRLLRVRAMNIARTESMTALSAGQQESWEVAVRDGIMVEGEMAREWTVFRPCRHICEPIPLRGPVGLREPFIDGRGIPVLYPPAHPSCRCVVNLVIRG